VGSESNTDESTVIVSARPVEHVTAPDGCASGALYRNRQETIATSKIFPKKSTIVDVDNQRGTVAMDGTAFFTTFFFTGFAHKLNGLWKERKHCVGNKKKGEMISVRNVFDALLLSYFRHTVPLHWPCRRSFLADPSVVLPNGSAVR
jgi:hypothetical protein